MADKKNTKWKDWEKKRRRIKGRLKIGTAPRLVIYRSNRNIFAQIVDDTLGKTILSVSSIDNSLKDQLAEISGNIEKGKILGKLLAEKALESNVTNVIFDRNGYKYHGVIKAFADATREAGLNY